jgi:hypothetical protein
LNHETTTQPPNCNTANTTSFTQKTTEKSTSSQILIDDNQRQFIKQAIEHKKRWISANGSPIHVAGQTSLTSTIGTTRFTAPFIIARN